MITEIAKIQAQSFNKFESFWTVAVRAYKCQDIFILSAL